MEIIKEVNYNKRQAEVLFQCAKANLIDEIKTATITRSYSHPEAIFLELECNGYFVKYEIGVRGAIKMRTSY